MSWQLGGLWLGWVGLIVGVAVANRPGRGRRVGPSPAQWGMGPAGSLGRWLRALARRRADPVADLRLGRAVLGGLAGVVVDVRLGAALVVAALIAPVLGARRARRRREAAVVRELPQVIDLLRLGLAAGGSVLNAVDMVGRHPIGPISAAFAAVRAQVDRGHRLADVLAGLGEALGEPVRPLVRALVGSEHYGTEVGPTLERLADEARHELRRRAQAEARRVPVRLLLPLVLGILPAFVLLTIVPTLAGTFDGLDLSEP